MNRDKQPIRVIVIPEDAYKQNDVYRPWVEPTRLTRPVTLETSPPDPPRRLLGSAGA